MYTITKTDGRVYQDLDGKRAKEDELIAGGSLVGLPGDEIDEADADRLGLMKFAAQPIVSIKAKLAAPENK